MAKERDDYGIISPSLAIDSMRRNGYLTTDMAIAELIDNSVDANAENIELLLFEDKVDLQRTVSRIVRIGVLDDGDAMDKEELRHGLRFGGGSEGPRQGIGRFGFGLPNSSISQADRAEVWTWRNGPDNAWWTYLDIEEIRSGRYEEVPEPEVKAVPKRARMFGDGLREKGTYVEWSNLDEDITWKRGRTVLKHTSSLVGRIYRHYLRKANESISIRMAVVNPDGELEREKQVKVNDPLYLMDDTSCPYDDEPMFQLYDYEPWTFQDKQGREQEVEVRISYAKPECRKVVAGKAAGHQEHGKHAKENIGVSIVRSGRELQLENVIHADPYRDRWWGVEISFPPELDELFGVSNNKQGANVLIDALKSFDSDSDLSVQKMIDSGDLDRNEDRVELYRMAQWVADQVRAVARLIEKQNVSESQDDDKRYEEDTIEDRASQPFKQRAEKQPTDEEKKEREDPTPEDEQVSVGKESLVEEGYSEDEAESIMEVALDRDRKVLFVEAHPRTTGDAIFDVKPLPGGRVEVKFNPNHPAHEQIFETLEGDAAGASEEALQLRLEQASDSLKLLFAAWVRMELEARQGQERNAYARIRRDWGRMAADFLEPRFANALEDLAE